MKKYLFMLATASLLAACNQGNVKQDNSAASEKIAVGNGPVIKFEKEIYDFGKVKAGDKVSYSYSFVNTGKSPLIITDAVASCGCTIPKWPKKPINPGEKNAIEVIFDSTGKSGLIDKQITVTANTAPAQTIVHLIGEVETKK